MSGYRFFRRLRFIVVGGIFLVVINVGFVRILFVRLLLATSPVLLLLVMLLTPAIQLVVTATLPDQSGVNRKRRRPMNWKNIGEKREP